MTKRKSASKNLTRRRNFDLRAPVKKPILNGRTLRLNFRVIRSNRNLLVSNIKLPPAQAERTSKRWPRLLSQTILLRRFPKAQSMTIL